MEKDRKLKQHTPAISIVMPCYNEEKRIRRAVDSILNQTFTDFEFIIFDDKSTDNSPQILEEYAAKDPRIVLIQNKKNVGYAEILNRGINIAKSEIIARMDSDDYSYPNRFEKQYSFLKKNPDIDIVGTSVRLINKETEDVIGVSHMFESHEEIVKNKYGSFNYHPSIMARKKLFIENGGYDVNVKRAEEYHLWLKACENFKFHNLQLILVDYSIRVDKDWPKLDNFISGFKVRFHAMVYKKELHSHFPQLIRYTLSFLRKKITNKKNSFNL